MELKKKKTQITEDTWSRPKVLQEVFSSQKGFILFSAGK